MKYTIICMVVGWLFANFLATRNINGQPVFPGPQAVPWEFNGCRSPFECLALAVLVVILFRNVLGQRNIEPATTVRIKTTTRAPTTTTTRAPTTLVPACPPRYLLYAEACGRFCYRFESSACRIWDDAQAVCRGEGGNLFAPSECSYGLFRGLANLMEGSCPTNFWLGARRSMSGGYIFTVNGDLVQNSANFWQPGQPDNANNIEDCMEMRKDFSNYLANDRSCDISQGYICQIMI